MRKCFGYDVKPKRYNYVVKLTTDTRKLVIKQL